MKSIHFIGIGGSGLSAIATVLLERGETVSGSDRSASPQLQRLVAAGARLYAGHAAENISHVDVVVRSSAVPDDNPEVLAARKAGIPVLKRREFLEYVLDRQIPLAVAGTHGKTTTTAMLAWTLVELGVDPSYVIGGMAVNLGTNAHAGGGRWFVIEADEYDRMFLGIRPQAAIVTNIEHDHPDCYPNPEDFFEAFRQFAGGIQAGGVLIACTDDPGAMRLLDATRDAHFDRLSYGIKGNADYAAHDLRSNRRGGLSFTVARNGATWLDSVELQVPGEHNVCNALAVLGIVDWMGLSPRAAASALGAFRGTGRRFELRGEAGGVMLIDDYAHHPTAIRTTLLAARQRYPDRRIWAVWQPHTYSRSRALQSDFASAFEAADRVLVTEIYAARETPPADGFSGRSLAHKMSAHRGELVNFAGSLDAASEILLNELQAGDLVLVLSAGDADQLTTRLLDTLADRPNILASTVRRKGHA